MHSVRARSADPRTVASPPTISRLRQARATSGRSTSWTTVPTSSAGYSVGPVTGRTWASTTNRWPSSPSTGAIATRSAKHRSASGCHDATSRWR